MNKFFKRIISIIVAVAIVVSCVNVQTTTVQAVETTDYTIKVNLGTNCVTVYDKKGKAIKAMPCSPSNTTPTGTFYIPAKYRWHQMMGGVYAQYCSRITGGILFHSVWYYTNGDNSSMSVREYNKMGTKASHGCVRLLCKDAKWIYDHCAVGTKVVIFWGDSGNDPLGKPSFTPITNGAWTSWDPTDPDPRNPYRKAEPQITANKTTIEYGSKVDVLDMVKIIDQYGNTLTEDNATIKTAGNINTKKLGKYKVKYYAKDSLGNDKYVAITFKVVDTKKPELKGAKGKSSIAMGSRVNLLYGVTAKAVSGKNLTSKIKVTVKKGKETLKVKKGIVTFSKTGTYKVTYEVKGSNGKETSKTVKYVVKDKRVKLKLTAKKIKIKAGTKFNPKKYIKSLATYKNNKISKNKYIKIKSNVKVKKPGNYKVTYTAQYKDYVLTKTSKTLKVKVVAVKKKKPHNSKKEETTTNKVEETTTGLVEETTTSVEEETTVSSEEEATSAIENETEA